MKKNSKYYKIWKDNPIEFWKKNAEEVSWIKFPEKILTKKNDYFYEWFSDGILNTCHNAVDKNILEGRGEQMQPLTQRLLLLNGNDQMLKYRRKGLREEV